MYKNISNDKTKAKKEVKMKNKTVMGIVLTILLLSIIAFSCCVDERTQLPTSSASGIEITVKYPDSWKGELYDLEHLRIVEGTGKKSFHQRNPRSGLIVANFWKKDNSGKTLTVEIRHNGKLVKLDSTNQPHGFVRVEYLI